MKHLSIALMSIACFLLSVTAGADDNNRTKLTVRNESFTGTNSGEVYRGLCYDVTLELIVDSHLIEISHFGIGDAEVYLLDRQGHVAEQIAIRDDSPKDYLDVPARYGNYKVVIWSDVYYGEACL